MESQKKLRVNVTLPPVLIDEVKTMARRERRSFSSQVQLLLERQLGDEDASGTPANQPRETGVPQAG